MIVPHLTTRMLFGIYLGSSKDYGWRDFSERLCGPPVERTKLLKEAGVRWVLVRDKRPTSRSTYDAFRICDVTMQDLPAKFPAAWSERDLALYEIAH